MNSIWIPYEFHMMLWQSENWTPFILYRRLSNYQEICGLVIHWGVIGNKNGIGNRNGVIGNECG
jgi:hypothetical protein